MWVFRTGFDVVVDQSQNFEVNRELALITQLDPLTKELVHEELVAFPQLARDVAPVNQFRLFTDFTCPLLVGWWGGQGQEVVRWCLQASLTRWLWWGS